ncbi:MAG TPA: hypothetical protein VM121_00740 [Acidimicrobiales bacterium]|nr:hypothetical protein [Acidimicrobiales bacterium]
MKRSAVAALVVLAALAAASSCSMATDTLYTKVTGSDGQSPTENQLQAALLTVSEMPSGFEPFDLDDVESDAESDSCGEAGNPDDPATEARTAFARGAVGPFVRIAIGTFPGRGAEVVATARQEFEACTTYSQVENDGSTTTLDVNPLSLPVLGDDSLGVRAEATGNRIPVAVDLVMIRRGDVIGVILAAGPAAAVNTSEVTEAVARKQADKMTAAFG